MKDLSKQAKLYILGSIAAGTGLTAWHLTHVESQLLWAWLILAIVAAATHILKVEGATARSSYQISLMVYGFTFLLLGAPATIFIILVAHLVEWAWHRYPWYIQFFNIAVFILSAGSADLVYSLAHQGSPGFGWSDILGVVLAMAVFTFINHGMVGLVVKLARGESFTQSGVFGRLTLMIDFSLLCMGAASAVIWSVSPFASILTLIPLYLIYSTLKVPALQRQTEIDPKTGLFNARYFARALEGELARADRFDRPMTIVMADLDLLRNINNTYGHLAGDQVLIGIADILRSSYRDYDVVARFGGEEFAILMPETTAEEAFPRVEAIRLAIERADFEIPTSVTPIKATMSFGIAGRVEFGHSPSDLIHNADLALYRAKLEGRNQTTIYSSQSFEELFPEDMPGLPAKDEASFEARLDHSQKPFVPPPLRKAPQARVPSQPQDERPSPAPPTALKPRAPWMLKSLIAALALVAAVATVSTIQPTSEVDWIGLALFSLVVLLTEGLSIEIYAKDTTVSTAVAPMAAGMVLFGPAGVVGLSLTQATTSWIKHRSQPERFVFNLSNQMIAGFLGIAPALLLDGDIAANSTLLNCALTLLATSVIYLTSTLLVSAVIDFDTGHDFLQVWTERFRWLAPYYLALGVVAIALLYGYLLSGPFGLFVILAPLLMLRFSQVQYIEHTRHSVQQLKEKNTLLEGHAVEIDSLNEELLQVLSQVIDVRDPYVLGHSQRVAHLATRLAGELGFSAERTEIVRKAALLHDVGKLGVREAILLKPDRLTNQEFDAVKDHVLVGARIVDSCHSFRKLVPIIRHHHERYDGSGYPDGLAGNKIPIEARILCLADAIEAMSSDRPYRSALSMAEILNEIQANAGRQFDPQLVRAMLALVKNEGTAATLPGVAETPQAAARPVEPVQAHARPSVPGQANPAPVSGRRHTTPRFLEPT